MAITFTEHSINGKILNAFNNNVVRYGTSLSKTIVNSEIKISQKCDFIPDDSHLDANTLIVLDGNNRGISAGIWELRYTNKNNWIEKNVDYFKVSINSDGGSSPTLWTINDIDDKYINTKIYVRFWIKGDTPNSLIFGANGNYTDVEFSDEWQLKKFSIVFDDFYADKRMFFLKSTSLLFYIKDIYISLLPDMDFEITPSPDDSFYFNFKTAIKKVINTALFADAINYSGIGQLWNDLNAYVEIYAQYLINFDDETFDNSIFTYQFIKGVNQLTEKAFFNERGIAFPLHKPVNKIAYLTYFKGFPFDVALFGEDIEISIDSFLSEAQFLAVDLPAMEVNPQTVTFQNDNGVNRLVISDGLTQWAQIIDKYHNIRYGDYEIRMRVEDKCGLYFKWHNEYGGWDYWLFEKNYLVNMSDNHKGEIQMDFDNLPDAKSIVASTGKVVEESLTLFANGVYDYEIQRVLGIARSPKVYMYTGEKDAQNDDDYWIEVQASAANPQYKHSTFRKTISVKVDVPSNYTLEL